MFLKRNLGLGSQMQHSQLALPMEPNVWAPDMATTDARNDAESWLWVDPGMSAFGHRVPQPHTKGYISNDSNGYQGWEMVCTRLPLTNTIEVLTPDPTDR